MIYKDILVVIPARGGSKGLPGKNIKKLLDKPLINYSVDVARKITTDDNICVSTDDLRIKEVVEDSGLFVPFLRPKDLATDTASTDDVLKHAVKFYLSKGITYSKLLLLQPTSPLRTSIQVQEALSLYNDSIDMVVSVSKSHAPSVLCQDDNDGFVELIYNKSAEGRQSVKEMFEYNGAIYIININSLMAKGLANFKRKVKYVMPKESSIDIDDIYDFYTVEAILKNKEI
jgi:N-acylneuraminate cytidylyltransferase